MKTAEDIYDELLVMRCQDGDGESLVALVSRWQPRLLRHAMRLTRQYEAACDVAQEAWVAIVRGIRHLDDPACFAPWAYRIVTNKCADWTRQRQRQRASMEPLTAEPAALDSSAEDAQDDVAAVRAAIKQLPHEQQVMLSLFYTGGLCLRDIAEALSLPVGTVKSRLHYARSRLKEVIDKGEANEGH
jgi:RNA polymerase sigma-70 factor, ECF subfamily